MNDEHLFRPAWHLGLAFHILVSAILIAFGVWGLWRAVQTQIGPDFLFYLTPFLLAIVLVPALAYRAYALYRASYRIQRDGIQLRWGLRQEDISMDEVLWIRPAGRLPEGFGGSPALPWLRLPGSVLGKRHQPGVGEIEFMAADTKSLILIATSERSYAISPADPDAFLTAYKHFTELGSLTPLPARSVFPSFLLARVWGDRPARMLLISSGVLSLILVAWVSLTIPSRAEVRLGFDAAGRPSDYVPSVQLFLLPVLNTLIFLGDLLLGLYFYRHEEDRLIAYLLWGSAAIVPLLFLAGVFFILQAG